MLGFESPIGLSLSDILGFVLLYNINEAVASDAIVAINNNPLTSHTDWPQLLFNIFFSHPASSTDVTLTNYTVSQLNPTKTEKNIYIQETHVLYPL